MSNSNSYKSHSEGSNRNTHGPVQAVLQGVQAQGLGNVATNLPRSDELLERPEKVPQRGVNSEVLQWMECTIIQISNQKNKGLEQQGKGGKQGRCPRSFYQKASPRREEEQEKKVEEITFPNLKDSKNQKRCHGQCLQHGQNLDGIQGQRRAMDETTPFPKEVTLLP
ncbi:hypothetical protein O181_048862 [Austropuccinia psidii MF-1]|uniref:Uncharacterized protein n=1 Tax=Austropuccinia psidii MF-1 TaxID=1389203 RepID=A0A9Q3E0N8_9BASI|nr:hypothetical protein [Austropuccinia psidii MF-1]